MQFWSGLSISFPWDGKPLILEWRVQVSLNLLHTIHSFSLLCQQKTSQPGILRLTLWRRTLRTNRSFLQTAWRWDQLFSWDSQFNLFSCLPTWPACPANLAKEIIYLQEHNKQQHVESLPSPRFIKTHHPISMLPPDLLNKAKVCRLILTISTEQTISNLKGDLCWPQC